MIAFIRGKLVQCQPAYAVVETAGVGYLLHISLATYSKIQDLQEVFILTHQIIKEDGHYLYGFAEEEEKLLFVQLISVNGVGPNTARVILSSLEPAEIKSAILQGNDLLFRKVKGVGPKTAQRIIIDLRDKVGKDAGNEVITISGSRLGIKSEAMSALLALGFARNSSEQVLKGIADKEVEELTLEELIKYCLKKLS